MYQPRSPRQPRGSRVFETRMLESKKEAFEQMGVTVTDWEPKAESIKHMSRYYDIFERGQVDTLGYEVYHAKGGRSDRPANCPTYLESLRLMIAALGGDHADDG